MFTEGIKTISLTNSANTSTCWLGHIVNFVNTCLNMNSLILPQMTTFVVILQMAEHLLLSLMTIQAYHLILIRLDAQFHLILIQQAKERLIHNSSVLLLCFPKFQEVLPQPWQRLVLLCEAFLLAFRPNQWPGRPQCTGETCTGKRFAGDNILQLCIKIFVNTC